MIVTELAKFRFVDGRLALVGVMLGATLDEIPREDHGALRGCGLTQAGAGSTVIQTN